MRGAGRGRAIPRRSVLAGTAAAGSVAGIGAAVGGCSQPSAQTDVGGMPVSTPADPAPSDGCARALARTTDIPLGGGTVFKDDRVVVTQPSPGEFKGFGVVCTHDGCELNSVAGGTINCPCHGSRFAITDGSVIQGPARSGLRQEAIAVDGGCIVLR
jgi:Rieske Fe-S protein